MRACLMVLAVLAMEATMTVGTLYVSSAYVSGGDARPSLATATGSLSMSVNPTTQGVTPGALDQVDLERAADLYRVTP